MCFNSLYHVGDGSYAFDCSVDAFGDLLYIVVAVAAAGVVVAAVVVVVVFNKMTI